MKYEIELAGQNKVSSKELEPFVNNVLDALGHPEALVTDDSIVWDFLPLNSGLEEVNKTISDAAKKLGTYVQSKDYIWEVAERVKDTKSK